MFLQFPTAVNAQKRDAAGSREDFIALRIAQQQGMFEIDVPLVTRGVQQSRFWFPALARIGGVRTIKDVVDASAARRKLSGHLPVDGREVLFGVETAHGDDLSAVYAIGPSVDNKHPAAWTRRKGRVIEDSFVFEEKSKSTLRLHPRQDGGLSATWISADGKTSMTAHLKPIDPQSLARRGQVKASAPVASAAAHGDGQETEE